IRGWSVTGVQTCALPIWLRSVPSLPAVRLHHGPGTRGGRRLVGQALVPRRREPARVRARPGAASPTPRTVTKERSGQLGRGGAGSDREDLHAVNSGGEAG